MGFVTIFDFENGRLGFAHPAEGVVQLSPSILDAVLPSNTSVEADMLYPKEYVFGSTLPQVGLTVLVAALVVGLVLRFRSRTTSQMFAHMSHLETNEMDAETTNN